MRQTDDLSKSLTPFVQDNTLIVVIELSLSSWLVAGVVPGVPRQPLKKLEPDETELLRLIQRWRDEAVTRGFAIERVVVAYEAGRDGFWLARWLRTHEIEAHVIHSTRAVSELVELRAWLGIGSSCESLPALTREEPCQPRIPMTFVSALSTRSSEVLRAATRRSSSR